MNFTHTRLWLVAFAASASVAGAQADSSGVRCLPVAKRTGELGCWITANAPIGKPGSNDVYWYIDAFDSREAAAAAGPSGTVVESLGRIWRFTISDKPIPPSGGKRVAEVGPLRVNTATSYTAQYMEAIFTPGMTAPAHRHSGPEAWYTVSGETCLETPDGILVGRAGGQQVIVPNGPPMYLTATGTQKRRALVLVLHDASQPATTLAHDWKPKGLCKP